MIKNEIRSFRSSMGFNLSEISRLLGIAKCTMSSYELGRKEVPIAKLRMMSFIFKRPIRDFYCSALQNELQDSDNKSVSEYCRSEIAKSRSQIELLKEKSKKSKEFDYFVKTEERYLEELYKRLYSA